MLTRWVLTLTMTNMWHPQPELSAPFAFPSWTISTLTAFYLIFPIIISSLSQLTSYKLNMLINILFLSQVIVNVVVNAIVSTMIDQTFLSLQASPLLALLHRWLRARQRSLMSTPTSQVRYT